MDFTLQEKAKLIEFFEFLLNNEIDKPLGEMNSEAVDSYIKILLFLQGKNIELSSEFIDEQVRKIFHKEDETTVIPDTVKTKKNYFNKKKVWLVAACIAILVALFSIISFSSEKGVVDTLEDFFGSYDIIPWGKEINVGDETYGKGSENTSYDSISDAVKSEEVAILFPVCLLKEYNIDQIVVDTQNESRRLVVTFENTSLSIEIFINSKLNQETIDICNKTINLNGIEYYLCIMEDVNQAQAYFTYDNKLYIITHYDEKSLMEILKNMEEIKYED